MADVFLIAGMVVAMVTAPPTLILGLAIFEQGRRGPAN